ncbi:recombinase family protein [Vibrio superstes]|uniref:Recombinase domain-containing protein n=1 Tax=Vibrio superstes NBRC 103154 TaxID=1219062 RepID=A0A511QRE9_9VIBR|nr:recombinase family protein [Vibrio superstes]GEM79456.1 hypothetical protein VSU01S_17010 [Vibrio superstes NBRC 103154]
MKAYSYKRFSSKGQETGDSIRRQTDLAEKYCIEHQLELSEDTYEDLGVSAWTGSNAHEDAGLGQFLLACQQGKIPSNSVLLVESLDRLSREKIKKAMRQLMDITDHVDVVTLIDKRRYTSDMDFSDFIIAGATMQRANEESEVKSKRLQAVWEAKRANPKGSKKTRKCPFWLNVTDDSMSFVVNDKVEIVRKVFELSSQGLGNLKVAKQINSMGFKTARGKDWSPANISILLKARTVLGEYQPTKSVDRKNVAIGDPVLDYYPKVISTELFNKVQLCIADRAKNIRMGSTSSHRNLLRNNGSCMCGGELFITSKRQGVSYFQCQNGVNGACEHGLFRFDVFLNFLKDQIIRPMYFNYWVTDSSNELEVKRDALVVEALVLQKKLDSLLELDVSNVSVNRSIGELAGKINVIEADISNIESDIAKAQLSTGKLQSVNSMYELIDLAGGSGSGQIEIHAREELRRMLNHFKIKLGNIDRCSLVSIEHFDKRSGARVKQVFQSAKTPSRAIRRLGKKGIWKLTDYDYEKN